MKLYRNIKEDVVEELFDDMKGKLGCCTCEQCRNDIVAYALNQLSPQYVVTTAGASVSKIANLRYQHAADIQAALMRGADVVSRSPRHQG